VDANLWPLRWIAGPAVAVAALFLIVNKCGPIPWQGRLLISTFLAVAGPLGVFNYEHQELFCYTSTEWSSCRFADLLADRGQRFLSADRIVKSTNLFVNHRILFFEIRDPLVCIYRLGRPGDEFPLVPLSSPLYQAFRQGKLRGDEKFPAWLHCSPPTKGGGLSPFVSYEVVTGLRCHVDHLEASTFTPHLEVEECDDTPDFIHHESTLWLLGLAFVEAVAAIAIFNLLRGDRVKVARVDEDFE
jgi:hypothetical protein